MLMRFTLEASISLSESEFHPVLAGTDSSEDLYSSTLSDEESSWDYNSEIEHFDEHSDLFVDKSSTKGTSRLSEGINIITFLCQFKGDPCAAQSSVVAAIARTKRSVEGVEQAAERHAMDSVIPPDFLTRDAAGLKREGCLESLVRSHQLARSEDRFNLQRFNALYSEDEEAETLRVLATTGARIDTAPGFEPIAEPDVMRDLQRRLPLTFRKHVVKLWQSGNVLVLPLADILPDKPHTSPLHCVFQDPILKPGGRLLGDLTNRSVGNSLNNIEAKQAIIERFGALSLPSIIEIILHILEVAEKVGGLHNVRIFKEDVVGAFGQFNFDPRDCRYVVFPFAPGYVIVYTTGMFGYSGCPFVFGVHTRSILRQIRQRIHDTSKADMYCDDLMGFSGVQTAARDQATVVDVIEGTFGYKTTCPAKKTLPAITGELIGWFLDLGEATIRPNDKGIDNLTRAFLSLEEDRLLSRREYQVLASLACRYSRALIGMRPFVRPLFNMVKVSRHKACKASIEAWTSILMWQAITICLIISPGQLAVSLYSFAKAISTDVQLISDAGPIALGLAIYVRGVCIGFVSYVLPFDAKDPSYQNCREFMGHLLGKLLLLKLRMENTCITHVTALQWTGDNMSALAWVTKQSCSSTNTQLAFLADCWLATVHNLTTTHVDHRAGVDMDDHDGLSRLKAHSFDPALDLQRLITPDIDAIFKLCDPTVASIDFTTLTFMRLLTLLVDIV